MKADDKKSEASVNFQRTARRYMPEDRNLHNHRCENLRSYKKEVYSDGSLPVSDRNSNVKMANKSF
jgi:hypothetical protein